MIVSLVALLSAPLFADAALYITLVEHPARLDLDDGPLLQQRQPSYKRALPVQSGLALLGGLAGLLAAIVPKDWRWLAGGVVLLSNWPFTLWAILPVNKRLMPWTPIEVMPRAGRCSCAGANSMR